MSVENHQISSVFEEIADLLEIKGANPFRVRAYRSAARKVEGLAVSLSAEVEGGADLTLHDAIGKDLALKIIEIISSGTAQALTDLKAELPDELPRLLRIQGLGPKRVGQLYQELGIESFKDLATAVDDGRIEALKGFGKKMVQNLQVSLENPELTEVRYLRASVEPMVDKLCSLMKSDPHALRVAVAGSFRRGRETVGDLDILVSADQSESIMTRVVEFEGCTRVLAHGETKSSIVLQSGIQVDVRVVRDESFGAALHYFTGSQAHNIEMRQRAQKRGYKLNEYGLCKDDVPVVGKEEEDVFRALELDLIPPELREGRGELALAESSALPRLLTLEDMLGDLHMHSLWSDGRHCIQEMAEAAAAKGYAYIAMTDHSKRLTVANGLDEARLLKQIEEIQAVNELGLPIHIFAGLEVDILDDGSLDMSDDVLGQLDLVIGSVHSKFNLNKQVQTDRIRKAMDHPRFTILGHATGRLLLERPAYEVDMEQLISHAVQRGCWMEVNSNPRRLDLNDLHIRMALGQGVPLVVNTDAHHKNQLDLMRHGVNQARRGGAEASQIMNTLDVEAFKSVVKATQL